jgi:hypothetical protein
MGRPKATKTKRAIARGMTDVEIAREINDKAILRRPQISTTDELDADAAVAVLQSLEAPGLSLLIEAIRLARSVEAGEQPEPEEIQLPGGVIEEAKKIKADAKEDLDEYAEISAQRAAIGRGPGVHPVGGNKSWQARRAQLFAERNLPSSKVSLASKREPQKSPKKRAKKS